MKTFTQKEVIEILDVNPNTLQVWLRDSLIIPSVANPKGRGATRVYSASDLTMIKIVSILSQFSYNRSSIKSLCDFLRGKLPSGRDAISIAKKNPHVRGLKGLITLKEDLLNPLYDRSGSPIILKMSDNKWDEIGQGIYTAIPGKNKIILIVNVSEIMAEIRKKITK